MNLARVFWHLRFKSFPIDTESGRTSERYRLAMWAMLASFATRFLGMGLMVLSVSWTVPYLGPERFGLWMTVASFAGMLSFLDLGVGNALTNRVAQTAAEDVPEKLQNVIGGGLVLLFGMSLVIASVLFVLVSILPWARILNIASSELAAEAETTLFVFSISFGLTIFCSGIARVFHGLQRGFEVHLAGALGLLAGFAVLYIVVQAQGGLPLLLATSMGGPIAGNLILLLLLIARGQLSFSGILRGIRSEPGHLTRVGGLFFILQIGTMVGWGADSIIISSALGPAAVAAYAVTKRLMMLVTVPLSIMNSPLWAAYADAHARSAKEFIRKTLYRSLGVSLLYSLPIALALVVFGDFVIDYWTSGKIEVPTSLLLAFCAFAVVEALGNAFAMFLNGVGVVKEQVYIVCVFVLLVLPLKLLAVESHGALGVVVAGLGVYLLVHIAGYSIFWRRIMDRFI